MMIQYRREKRWNRTRIKMNFFAFLTTLHLLLHIGNSDILKSNYNIVKSTLTFYRSHSAILSYDCNKEYELQDMTASLNLQKFLSFNNFYFSTLTTLSALSKTLTNGLRWQKETIAVLELNQNFIKFLSKASNATVTTYYKWLLISKSPSQNIDELTIPLDCEVIIACKDPDEGFQISETYSIDRNRKLTKPLGRWAGGDKFHLSTSPDFFTRRKNFEGARIKVISPKKDNCLDISFSMGVAAVVWCIHQTVWEVIAEMLNATTEVAAVPDLTPDVIENTDAELTFRSAPLNVEDLNTRSYLWPVFRVKVEVVTSYIKPEVEWKTYILPFGSEMWAAILLWTVFCDFILTFLELIAEEREKGNFFSLYCSEFSFAGAFVVCSQGVLGPTKFAGIRIIFVMMFVVPAVLFPGYSAVLTSYLTVQLHKKPFQSLEELSRQPEYKIGWHNTFPLQHMFNLEDKNPLNRAILMNNVLPKEALPATDAEGIERMCKEKFVFLTIKDTILALKPKCSYYTLPQHFRLVFTSIEIKKNSWYKYIMDRCERSLDFTGTLYRLKLQAVMKYVMYDEAFIVDVGDFPPIKLENIVLPFAVLLLGAIASLLVLAVEVTCFKLISTHGHGFKSKKKST